MTDSQPAAFMPGSRYAAELSKGARDMRFPPELEREYHRFYLAERRSHVRFFNAVVCALVLFALSASLISSHENTGPAQYLRLGAIAAAYFLLAWIARSHYFERAYLRAASLAARDGLTGLKNRRAFDEHLPRAWQQALRDRRSMAVVMVDVDHFKPFNDRYGHQAGDDALQRVSVVVDGFAQRPLDLAARYGGEEPAVILFDVNREHAEKIAELAVQARLPAG